MRLLSESEWRVADAISAIGFTNPFLPERIELERKALGKTFTNFQPFVQFRPDFSVSDMFPNATDLRIKSEKLLDKMRANLIRGERANENDLHVYEKLAFFQLYSRYMATILDLPTARFRRRPEDDILKCYDAFAKDFHYYLELPEQTFPSELEKEMIFAGLFQVERAFFHVFRHIVGSSLSAAKLRASIWQSIFSHNMNRYQRALHQVMGDIPTLITGPSGTGKELVAKAIAYSRFVPFDSNKRKFVADYASGFVGLNLSAVSPSLIESELFGHSKGAFTGAISERKGFLDESNCPSWGTVFLDEIGELAPQVQVKLLRVLQSREFQRVGDSETQPFVGKIIAATNRDLSHEMHSGQFREDFYYRLCADRIQTPSLCAQLQESPEDMEIFVRFIGVRLLPEMPEEVERLTTEVVDWIEKHLGSDYAWPGNFRELEQCVRSIVIRGEYSPPTKQKPIAARPIQSFLDEVEQVKLNRDELLKKYFSLVYAKRKNYRAVGRELGVDWRTVKEIVDPGLVERFDDGE